VTQAKTIKSILFLCVANSARSQMAEGLARKVLGKDFLIQSAGSRPSQLHPLAIQVMKEIGIDISAHISKSVEDIDAKRVDLVVTLCEQEVCPAFLGHSKRLHWPFPDPAESVKNQEEFRKRFRRVRDKLLEKVTLLKKEMEK
jgi:arsenate reductase